MPYVNGIEVSGSDFIAASSFGQLGTTARPLPAGSLPDIGSIEISQALSTSPTVNNDVITGSSAANNLSGSPATTTSRAWAATTR